MTRKRLAQLAAQALSWNAILGGLALYPDVLRGFKPLADVPKLHRRLLLAVLERPTSAVAVQHQRVEDRDLLR